MVFLLAVAGLVLSTFLKIMTLKTLLFDTVRKMPANRFQKEIKEVKIKQDSDGKKAYSFLIAK